MFARGEWDERGRESSARAVNVIFSKSLISRCQLRITLRREDLSVGVEINGINDFYWVSRKERMIKGEEK